MSTIVLATPVALGGAPAHARAPSLAADPGDLDLLSPAAAALLAPELTSAHRGGAPRCLTPELHELGLHRDALPPWLAERLLLLGRADAGQARLDLGRPWSAGAVRSTRFPLAVHYRTRFYQQRAAEVLAMAEASWEAELAMGFYPAEADLGKGGDDRLDLYLTSEVRSGGGAYTTLSWEDPDPGDGIQTSPAYIAIYEDLDMEEEMPVFVAHELNHALQAAMDVTETTFLWEATATAMEDLVFDDVNDYYGFIDDFQARPFYGLNEDAGIYPYGGVVFTQYLDQALGEADGHVLAELWQRTGQPSEVNEPDYLDVLDELAREQGRSGLSAVLADFAGWRFFAVDLDDGDHLEEAGSWPASCKVKVIQALTSAHLPASGLTAPSGSGQEPQDLGANYFTVDTHDLGSASLSVSLVGHASTRWGVTAVRWYADAPGEVVSLGEAGASAQLSASVAVDGADLVAFSVLNLGPSGFDAEDTPAAAPYTLGIQAR